MSLKKIIAGGLVAIISAYFSGVKPVVVEGQSMYPTLKENQILLMKKTNDKIEKGDIVVIDWSAKTIDKSYGENRYIIKRIIACEGETVCYQLEKDGKNKAYNTKLIAGGREYDVQLPAFLQLNRFLSIYKKQHQKIPEQKIMISEINIPEGSYFVLGDNSYNSESGIVTKEQVIGKVM